MHPARGSREKRLRVWPIALALAAATVVLLIVFRFVQIRSDLADFLPTGETPTARLMLGEIRSGEATRVILLGLEGVPSAELARISAAATASLIRSGLFEFVSNGQQGLAPAELDFLFRHRYLLASGIDPASFTVPALRADLARLLKGLQSSASPLVQRYGIGDPPGAFALVAKLWAGASTVRTVGGVWFAGERDRALIVAESRAAGMNLAAQEEVAAAIDRAFAEAGPSGARLLAAGPAIFAREAARGIRDDVRLLSIVSALLIAALLLWRFRSLWVVAVIAVPLMLGVAAAALAVEAAFGFVHGIALGFGMTMLGVTADYPVLLIGHRKQGEQARGTLLRIGATFSLAVLSAAIGLTGMLFSGLPGLSQLGLFSVVGVLSAAAATRWLLPVLIVRADLAPVSSGDPARLLAIEGLRRYRLWALMPLVAAALLLLLQPPRWTTDLASLTPVPKPALALDAELRAELGVPDVGQLAIVEGELADTVLAREEALLPRLDRLRAEHAIAGAEFAARYLPSTALQRQRQAALPEAEVLRQRLDEAVAETPFRPEAFDAFQEDVEETRTARPVTLADITSPMLAARIRALLFQRDGLWYGIVDPLRISDAGAFRQALSGIAGVTAIDIGAETNGMMLAYTRQAARWLLFGGLAALLALGIGLRSFARVGTVLVPIASALLCTLALLSVARISLSLIHLVSLGFVTGVGLDYALFFARRQLDQEERARTLRTLLTCNVMTLLTFGLLAFCVTPILSDIGLTVAAGALSAMIFAFLFAGVRPEHA